MSSRKALSRRSFLQRVSVVTGGFVGLPYIIPSSALGRDGYVSPSNRITMACIGYGSQGSGNLENFLGMSDVQVVAVCDVDQNRLQRGKRRIDESNQNQDCRTYRDFRELLANEKLDTVCHAIPDHWHAAISVACARAGLDIYGEKPLARTIRESRAICDAVDRYGIIWQTGSWQRSQRNFRRGCELVRNGRLGKLHRIEVGLPNGGGSKIAGESPVPAGLDWQMWLGPAPWRPFMNYSNQAPHWDWRWIMDFSGGQLTDWAGHHIDIANWGAGLEETGPVTIQGQGKYYTEGVYDVPYAYDFECVYANGITMRVANSSASPKGMGTTWYGDRGWIHVDRGDVLEASDSKILNEVIGQSETRLYVSEDHYRNFIDCVRSRRETITPARVAHRSITVGLLGEIAMLTRRKLQWDPQTEQFIKDDEANRYLARPFRGSWHL